MPLFTKEQSQEVKPDIVKFKNFIFAPDKPLGRQNVMIQRVTILKFCFKLYDLNNPSGA